MGNSLSAIRGAFFDFVDDPWRHVGSEHNSARFFQDGLLVIENGKVKDFGPYDDLSRLYSNVPTEHIKERLILPGFIDGHIHMAQTRVLGAFGEQLLPWLHKWIFREEKKYSDPVYAREGAKNFFDNLLAAGTTTCQAFTTHDPVSTEAFFEEATRRNMRVIGGLTGIDRFAPDGSMDSAENFYRDSKRLIEKWHKSGRNLYAITPRFALGCTPAMMAACERLHEEFPDTYINTHISETPSETRQCNDYHQTPDYLAAYERYNLVGPRFTAGHGVWLSDDEFVRLSKSGAAICFCPTSNFFLGSGLFRLGKAKDPQHPVKLSFGSDVGGGNNFSMLAVLDDAYKVGMVNSTIMDGNLDPRSYDTAQAERNKLSPYRAFWSITLGGAESLYLADKIGNFGQGKEADFVVLDWTSGQRSMQWHASLLAADGPTTMEEAAELLFSIMMVGDDRNVDQTFIAGKQAYSRSAEGAALATTR
jgi:guanine deaminase